MVVVNETFNNSYTENITEFSAQNEPFYEFVHILYKYFIPFLCVFGIVGNVLSFRVFIFTSFAKQPSSVYLAALSVSDTWFLSALLVSWVGSIDRFATQSRVFCMISIYITYVTSFLSIWYVVLIMLDRYIVVCHPLKGPRMCSRQRVLIALSIITAFAMLFYSHCFFTMKTDQIDDNERQLCRIRESYYHVLRVITYFDSIVTFIIPIAAVFVFNIAVIRAIRRFYFRQFQMSHGRLYSSTSPLYNILSKAQVRLTVMLIIVSSVFLVLNLPSHGIRFFILVNDFLKRRQENFHLFLIQHCLQIMYYINFAINFVLYCTFSKSFRRCFKESSRCQKF
ncbi:thyrotropin-releasing hormone receptor-like [Ostrea edulis]|uniref:thyrotropin-releasing hormone receptor-like n=1 Tax=Ostrea edulis TaxID=37623 RepID=UPI0024AF356F|nr:thyrotropin-releasing hormone receptor-like [Ostrea edulis]